MAYTAKILAVNDHLDGFDVTYEIRDEGNVVVFTHTQGFPVVRKLVPYMGEATIFDENGDPHTVATEFNEETDEWVPTSLAVVQESIANVVRDIVKRRVNAPTPVQQGDSFDLGS